MTTTGLATRITTTTGQRYTAQRNIRPFANVEVVGKPWRGKSQPIGLTTTTTGIILQGNLDISIAQHGHNADAIQNCAGGRDKWHPHSWISNTRRTRNVLSMWRAISEQADHCLEGTNRNLQHGYAPDKPLPDMTTDFSVGKIWMDGIVASNIRQWSSKECHQEGAMI